MEKIGENYLPDKRYLLKMLLTMKFIVLFLCLSLSQVFGRAYSQQVTLRMENATFQEVARELEHQTGLTFLYHVQRVNQLKHLNLEFNKAEMSDVLAECLKGSGLSFRVVGNTVVITPATGIPAQSQKKVTLKGKVTDKAGEPLPGVAILIKGTTFGISTDADGKFEISVPAIKDLALVFTFIGMKPQEVAYKGQPEINVVMEAQTTEMDEVVVTGIFAKARESYTGAATTITAADLKKVGNRSILTSIRNIDPSFNIIDNPTIGSDPNALPDITVRGNSSLDVSVKDLQSDSEAQSSANLPLFIMDGFEITLERMMDLDENQVENITLLKDASATAMYGTRGANGVVVITTKKPEAGRLLVTYKGSVNIEVPDLTSYDLLNAAEKLAYEKAAGLYETDIFNKQQGLYDLYNSRLMDVERGVDTYWLKYPVRTGVGHRHSLRLEGGTEALRYAAALSYNGVTGAMKGSKRETINGNVFLSYKYKTVTFQNDLQVSINHSEDSPYGTFSDYGRLNAYWKPYDEEGNLIKSFEYMPGYNKEKIENPLHNASLPGLNKKKYTEIRNNFAVDWYILPELFVRGRFGINGKTTRSDKYLSKDHTSFEDYTGDDYDRRGSYTYGTGENFNYEADLTLNYSKTFHEIHQLYVGLGYNVAQNKSESYTIKAEGFSDLNMDFLTMAGQYAKNSKPGGSESSSRRIGGIANVNYTFNRKYFVDASGKFDGSSQFGANKRFAPFWSVGMGWNIHQEDFAKESKWLNTARIRLSYGTSGSQSFSSYQAKTTYKYFGSNYSSWNGAYVMALGNDELGWQVTRQWNLGIDMDLFNGRLRINADVYNKITDNLLSDITLPSASGFPNYKANVGKVVNRGVELTLNAYIIRDSERDLMWSVGGSLAHNKNEIKEISNSLKFLNEKLQEEAGSNPSFLFEEGQSMNTIFVVPSRGIDPSTGKELFVKKDGSLTTVWDAKDKVPCGVSEPKVWGNLNTMFRWKGVSLNAVFGYRLGGQMYNSTLISKVENIEPYENADKRVLYDRWKNPGDRVFFKSVKDQTETKASSRFVMDERTLECRSVSLSYDWDAAWLKNNLGVSYLTVSGYMEDVFRISSVKQERGLNYPFARKFSVSLTARF